MRRTKAAALETRAKILGSALDSFSEKSFANASLTKIAANVGLTKGALYWHFRNKNDLLLRLIEEICHRKEDETKGILDEPCSAEKLKLFYMTQLSQMMNDSTTQKVHRIMMKRDEWPEDIQDNVTQILKDSFDREKNMVEEYIRKGVESGQFSKGVSPEGLAVLLSGVFHGLCAMHLIGLLPKDLPQYIDILFNALNRDLCANEQS